MFLLTEDQKETMEAHNINQVICLSGSSIVVGDSSTKSDVSYFIHADDMAEPIYMTKYELKILAYSLLNMV